MKAWSTQRVVVGAGEPAERSLTDALAALGYPLNARCGQRGLCRGCEVEHLEGTLVDAAGRTVSRGTTVRSCEVRVPLGGRAVVGIPAQARIGEATGVGDTFLVDVPFDLAPMFPAGGGRDTGVAIDVGTTTVVVLLADLATGEVLSRAGGFNAQVRFGDNVVSRIAAAADPSIRGKMRRALIDETIAPLIAEACRRAGRDPCRLAGATVAGNTAMLHILADVDPSPLGVAPFAAPFLGPRRLRPADVGPADVGPAPEIPLQLLPGLAAYIGADIAAGLHATGMRYDREPALLVDMGTNGEVVLCHRGRMVACATAAGPAFEGGGLSGGMRAQAGAAGAVRVARDPFTVEVETLGGGPAAGICGSAYIDFLATARASGLLRGNGRFDPDAWQAMPDRHRGDDDGVRAFLLGDAGAASISEVDIAHLLQAKAAIGAGIATLLATCGVTADEIGRVDLAGGFGLHVDVGHAIAIGLLPGFHAGQVRVVGNTSLAGALIALLDRTGLDAMDELRGRIDIVELNLQPDFEDRYIDHLALP